MKLSHLLFILILLIGTGCNTSSPKPISLSIIHMNDIHSHLDEEPLDLTFNTHTVRVNAGGYPRIATAIASFQNQEHNTLLLNAGDALQGTLYYTLFKGEVDAKMMNALKWDAFVLGNHEFDDGDANLDRFINSLEIPTVAANVVPRADDPLYKKWQPYIIRYFEGEAVGIIGIDNVRDTTISSNPSQKITFFDEINTTKRYVKELEALGVNKIILLSHFGFENDKKLSKQVEGVDVIVGGHTHTLMGSLSDIGLLSPLSYPQKVMSPDGQSVCIVQAGSFAKVVGNLHVDFNSKGEVESCYGTTLLTLDEHFSIKNPQGVYEEVNASLKNEILEQITHRDDVAIVPKDPKVQSILQEYKAQVDKRKKESIGTAKESIYHVRIPGESYDSANLPLGSDVAPIVAKAFYERINSSDAVILNAGAVRTSIAQGDISIETAYTLLPFSNTLYTFMMRGSEVHAVLEDALSNIADQSGSTGAFPYAYALRYSVNMSQSRGSRISELEIFDKKEQRYLPLQDDTLYTIATISYLASGKDGYSTFSTLLGEDTYFDYANSFVVYVKNLHVNGKTVEKLPQHEHCIKSYTK